MFEVNTSARTAQGFAAVLMAGGLLLAGCSSDSEPSTPTAEQQLCDARASVKTSFQTVADDLKALNFGQAKTDLAGVQTSLDQLSTARGNVTDETKAQIDPDIATLKSSLASVLSAGSLTEASAAIARAKTAFDSALQKIGDAANCS